MISASEAAVWNAFTSLHTVLAAMRCLLTHCGPSLERSAWGRYLVDHSASFQATAQY